MPDPPARASIAGINGDPSGKRAKGRSKNYLPYCIRRAHGFPRFLRQRSLQCRTSSQQRSHFLRHEKGRPQVAQVFCGRCGFLAASGIGRFVAVAI
jgi:hypothetical protein